MRRASNTRHLVYAVGAALDRPALIESLDKRSKGELDAFDLTVWIHGEDCGWRLGRREKIRDALEADDRHRALLRARYRLKGRAR